MPTYHYRCQSCQREQAIIHGMLEAMTPVCESCGHFCDKMIQSAPAVLSAKTMPEIFPANDAVTPAHDCGASCVLHRLGPKPAAKESGPTVQS